MQMHKMLSKLVFKISALLLLFLVLSNGEDCHKNGEVKKEGVAKIDPMTSSPFPDLLHIFFRPGEITPGNILPFYFGGAFVTKYPHFIPKEKADKIPFSTKQLPDILKFFGFHQGSRQAKAIDYALTTCEMKATHGLVKFCTTSFESMMEDVWKNMNPNTKSIKPLSTTPLPKSSKKLQNYKVLAKPKTLPGSENVLGCHLMTYPYTVYFCHRPAGATKLLEIQLLGEDGAKINAIATCHLDTFYWGEDIDAFRYLGTGPGEPVCHIFPPNDLIWVPSYNDTANAKAPTTPVM